MKPRRNPKFTSDSLTSGYCFTIATKGELDSITKGELDSITKGELDSITKGELDSITKGTGLNYKGGTGQRYPQNFYKGGNFLHTYWYKLQSGNYWRYS
jgi:hypothetical protein